MLKIGVIGCGNWGPRLARNFHELPDAELSWLCDLKPDRLNRLKRLYPQSRTSQNYHDLLTADLDAIVIATPVGTHHRLALEALRCGKHVLVEKPLAASMAEAEEIVIESEAQGCVLMVGHINEYNPAVEAVKSIIDSGELGEIYYINGVRVNLGIFQPDINVIWDLAVHDISMLHFVLGIEPEAVSAQGGIYIQRIRGIHDVAYLTFYFTNGAMANVHVSWLDPCKIRRYTVVGSKKMLIYNDVHPRHKVFICDAAVEIPTNLDMATASHLLYHRGNMQPYPVNWVEPLKVQCQHFLDCIREGQEPRSSGYVGLKVVHVLETAQRSLLNGGKLENIPWNKVILPASHQM